MSCSCIITWSFVILHKLSSRNLERAGKLSLVVAQTLTSFEKWVCTQASLNAVRGVINGNWLRPRPHVSGYFENESFFIRFGFPSTRRRRFRSPKTKLFENGLQSGYFWKRRFPVVVWTGENGAFRKRWRHGLDSTFHPIWRTILLQCCWLYCQVWLPV